MAFHDSLGDRMKGYEAVSKTALMKRTPVCLRLDGKAFHTFARGFQKPFDTILANSMQATMIALCESIQGAVLGYTQSDEITLILEDYHDVNICPWFDNEVQKMCSVAASIATLEFNKAFNCFAYEWEHRLDVISKINAKDDATIKLRDTYRRASEKGAMFDCRAFNVPVNDCANVIVWRQKDAERNSVQMVGQANFSHKQLQGKTCNQIQEMLFSEKGINWNNTPTKFKRGSCAIKKPVEIKPGVTRNKWVIDNEIPIFTQDRAYIERLIVFDPKEQ